MELSESAAAIHEAIKAQAPEGAVVTGFVLVTEIAVPDGRGIGMFTDEGGTPWKYRGMLEHVLAGDYFVEPDERRIEEGGG